jgi:hypothetical protein
VWADLHGLDDAATRRKTMKYWQLSPDLMRSSDSGHDGNTEVPTASDDGRQD